MYLWPYYTIAAVLFIAAIGLFYWGLWGDRSKSRLRCPKCWYDMTGSFAAGKLVCPECGLDAGVEKKLRMNRRRWFMIAPSGLVLFVYLAIASYGLKSWYDASREVQAANAIEDLGGVVQWYYVGPFYFRELVPDSLAYKAQGLDWAISVIPDTRPSIDAGLANLRGLPNLRYIDLSPSNVTDAGLVHLQGVPQLVQLYLEGTKVTDAGVAHLQSLVQLEFLNLSDTQVTDAGLVYLKDLTQLKHLNMRDTQVTDAGVAELQEALPHCRIGY